MHRLYLSRHCGGRGLLSVEVMCRQQERQLRIYFKTQHSVLHKAICTQDRNYTPLQLCTEEYEPRYLTPKERAEQWRAKEFHGRFANALNCENTDSVCSTEWIRTAGLFGEIEGFIFAIQDQVITTRSYQTHIMGMNCSDKCQLCKHATESIQHICSGCPALVQKDYLERHNSVAKVVHHALAKRYGLTEKELPYNKCKPEQVVSNYKAKLLWDTPITPLKPTDLI
jgi:hypothetical protein